MPEKVSILLEREVLVPIKFNKTNALNCNDINPN